MAVRLDDVLCYSKGQSPVVVIPQRKTKKYNIENIKGIDWFYYLVPNDTDISLSDRIGINELENMFVVCLTLPPSQTKFGKEKKEKLTRLFTAFDSVLDFLHYAKTIEITKWWFFEVILGTRPQKLYFDIDVARDELVKNGIITDNDNEMQAQWEMDMFMRKFLTELISRIVNIFHKRSYPIDLRRNILLFSSNSTKKRIASPLWLRLHSPCFLVRQASTGHPA